MLEMFSINLTPFNQERNVRVYLPKSYDNLDQHYPTMYMHDGKNVFRDEDAAGGKSLELENYLDEHNIDLIVIGIDQPSTFEERVNQYCPWVNGEYCKTKFGDERELGGKGKEYIKFIVNELKPLIDEKYRTRTDHTMMAGISLGGLISTYAACIYPGIFTKVAGLSSGFWRNQEEIESLIKKADFSKIEGIYLDCGTTETNDEYINAGFLDSNRRIYSLLEEKVSNTTFNVIDEGEHNYNAFQKRVPAFTGFILQDQVKTELQS
ncbi:alpha/beta hydrolase [Bacillus sp. Marseille-Q3570]|uniref:alpha/beta hydrolase n=1 Tax=Bacillus sp. Marseille-Q3570 TaxID=2963522 RepID=UPI0021B774A6|nr:alpha/beta hydrolase-fold protein [Bacillus sp. Marseille-Q3570]